MKRRNKIRIRALHWLAQPEPNPLLILAVDWVAK